MLAPVVGLLTGGVKKTVFGITDKHSHTHSLPLKTAVSSVASKAALCLLVLFSLFVSGCFVDPDPISEDEHFSRFLEDKAGLAETQYPPTGVITVSEAIARTIKYNLDNRLAQMESAFALDLLDATKLQMLPRLAVNAGYSIRNKESASTSISYEKRNVSLEPSVSSQVNRVSGDIGFSWSILDFGLSYFQAKQQADRYLILMERRRRIMNNLVKDVITAYYRLASLEKVAPLVDEAVVEAEKALESYRKLEETRTGPLASALEQQRSILFILGQMRQFRTDLAISRARLGALMNLPHGCEYSIQPVEGMDFTLPALQVDLAQLEDLGMFLRPDLREESYQARINKNEARRELIKMFPGVSLFSGLNYDSNRYLENSFWAEAGAKVTMDVIGLAAKFKQYKASKTQMEVSRIRRLAATVAAVMQIDMSYYQYQLAISQFKDSRELNRIDGKLLEISSAAAESKSIGRMEFVMQSVSSVNSRIDMDRRLMEVLNAWANLYFSVGGDMLGELTGNEELEWLTTAADQGLRRWLSGELPEMPGMPYLQGGRIASCEPCEVAARASETVVSVVEREVVVQQPVVPGIQEADVVAKAMPKKPVAAAVATVRREK